MTGAVLGHARHTRLPQIWQRLLEVFEVAVEHHYAAPWRSADCRSRHANSRARG